MGHMGTWRAWLAAAVLKVGARALPPGLLFRGITLETLVTAGDLAGVSRASRS